MRVRKITNKNQINSKQKNEINKATTKGRNQSDSNSNGMHICSDLIDCFMLKNVWRVDIDNRIVGIKKVSAQSVINIKK